MCCTDQSMSLTKLPVTWTGNWVCDMSFRMDFGNEFEDTGRRPSLGHTEQYFFLQMLAALAEPTKVLP